MGSTENTVNLNIMYLKVMVHNLLFVLFAGASLASYGQGLKTFRGYVDSKSQLSHTSTLNESKRITLLKHLKPYLLREAVLTDYFTKLNQGDTIAANKILEGDKFLRNKDDFTIAYMFSLVRMQALNELFKPCIQIYDDEARGIVITCTKEQFADLTEEDTKIFEVTCRFIGELLVDKVKLYEMVRYR
jgi:hypothetical protein